MSSSVRLRIAGLNYLFSGESTHHGGRERVGECALADYLQAPDILRSREDPLDKGVTGLPDDFEALRWFHLPGVSSAGRVLGEQRPIVKTGPRRRVTA